MRARLPALVLGLVVCSAAATVRSQVFNVTLLHTPPSRSLEGEPIRISGNVIGADQVSIAALAFRVAGQQDYEIRELKLVSGDRYEGLIPGERVKAPAVEYFCYAVDFDGERHAIFASKQEPQRIVVVAQAELEPGARDEERARAEPRPASETDHEARAEPEPRTPSELPFRAAEDVLELATRSPQTVERAPAIASVVGREQIVGMGARTVADVLDQLPGISVARSVSGDYRLSVRGVQSDPEILVLLDGHRLNDLYSGAALLEFPVEAVERLEVIRGPESALYGTGAFVGVIDIISRQSTEPHASAAYGLFHQVRASAGGGYGKRDFEIGGQVQFVRSDGQDREVGRDVLTGVEGTTHTSSDDVSNTKGPVDDSRLQLHAQLSAAVRNLGGGELSLLGHYLFQTRGAFVGKYNSLDRGSDLSVHLVNADLRFRLPVGDWLKLDAKAYFDTHVVERAFQVIRPPPNPNGNAYIAGDVILSAGLREIDSYQSLTGGAEVSSNFRLAEANHLVAGVQFEYARLLDFAQRRDTGGVACSGCSASSDGCVLIKAFELPCGSHAGAASGRDRIVVGFFAQDHWRDLLPGLDVLAGFRLDLFTDFGLTINPRFAVVYGPVEGLRLKLLYAQAFRAPTFQELYDDAQFDPIRSFLGNDELEPVKINSLELGVEGHVETKPVDYRLRANFFIHWIDDSVVSVDTGSGLPTYDNLESLFVFGTEVEGVARFGRRCRLFVNSSWFRAEVEVAGRAEPSYITDVPQMRLNLGMDLALFEWLNVHLGLRYGSARRNNVRQRVEMLRSFHIPAYTLVRVGLSTEPLLFDHLVFFVHAYNVFDHDLRDPPPRPDHLTEYLPRAPFSFMAGVGWRP